jgi:hypothetical protein
MSALSSASRTRGRGPSTFGCASAAGATTSATDARAPIHCSASSTKASALVAVSASSRSGPPRSAGRRAAPAGMRTVNVLPRPTSLVTETVPWCSPESSRTSARPMPDPS